LVNAQTVEVDFGAGDFSGLATNQELSEGSKETIRVRYNRLGEVDQMRFEARELKPYAEPVLPEPLQIGAVYFSVIFLDEDALVPTLLPKVFVGPKVQPEGTQLYFQDFASYHLGIRFESPDAEEEATFETGAGRYIFEYERALDVLMACALRRGKTPNA
jgi:hypothetical protein